MTSTTIHLIRHGEVHNPDDIHYGRFQNYWLSSRGIEQAKSAAQALATNDIAAVYTSPMERAQQTASIIAEPHEERHYQIDERLHEVYTPYDGTPRKELEKRNYDLYTDTDKDYEKPSDILRRTLDFIAQMKSRYVGREVVGVTHGDVIVFMVLYSQHEPLKVHQKGQLKDYGIDDEYPQTASINSFTYYGDDPDEIPTYRYMRPYELG